MRRPLCGSIAPDHRARQCRDCRRAYKRRTGKGFPRYIPDPASCVFCGIAQGNSLRIKVIRYPLLRHIDKNGRHTSVCIGSMPMCDPCVAQNGKLNERTLGRAA